LQITTRVQVVHEEVVAFRQQPLFLSLSSRYATGMIITIRHTIFAIVIACAGATLLVSAETLAQDLSGRWQGTLVSAQYDPIDVIFNLHKAEADDFHTGTLDIPDQFRSALPIDSVSIRDKLITIRLSSIQAEYYGSLIMAENGEVIAIEGDWSQSGEYVPLRLDASPAQNGNEQ
jgi:hypothetical protein